MERIAVQSRDIAIVGYDNQEHLLEIAFRGGGVYHYRSVPQDIFRNLLDAPSQGIFFNQQIKDCYPYIKIN